MTDQNPTQTILTAILEELRQLRQESRAAALLGDYGYRWTPDGLPICPKHGEVMTRREKQGDTWYSHQVTDPATGEVHYCRGHEGKNSPGWNSGNTPPPAPTPPAPAPASQPQPRQAPAKAAPPPTGQADKPANGQTAKTGQPAPAQIDGVELQRTATTPAQAAAAATILASPVKDARLKFYEVGSAAMTTGKLTVEQFNGLVNRAGREGFAVALP